MSRLILSRGLSHTRCMTRMSQPLRTFSQSAKRQGHDHSHGHEEQVEEHFLNNPQYLAFGAGIVISSLGLMYDNSYKKKHGESFFGKFIHPTSDEHINKENVSYVADTIAKDIKLHEAFFAQKKPDPFGKVDFSTVISVIPRGSPFNSTPGSHPVDIDNINVRASKKSVFD